MMGNAADMGWQEVCDVLVVGSGAGGMTAAYTAAREGLSVLLIESTTHLGGTSAYSGGGMWLPGNAVLQRGGGDADMARARAYYHAVVGTRTPRALQDTYLDTGARLIDYLEQDPHFAFEVYPWPDYYGALDTASAQGRHIVPSPLPAAVLGAGRQQLRPNLAEEQAGAPLADTLIGGQALIGRFLYALQAMPQAALRVQHRLQTLVTDAQGQVMGAEVQTPEGLRRIQARHGVVLAAGGFERNAALRAGFGVPGEERGAMGPEGNDGGALQAALALGAAVDLMDQAWWSPGLMRPNGRATFTLGFAGGLFVDQNGQRFMNESLPYDRAGRTIIARQQAGQLQLPFWFIYDDRDGGMPPILYPNLPIGDLAPYRAAGLLRSADTLESLATAIDVPPEALTQSVQRFNQHAQAQHDADFGRGEEPYDRLLIGHQFPMQPLGPGPWHALAFGLSDLGTKGGLQTDVHARVLNTQGQPIVGLYATGNTMAAVSGETYPGGGNPVGSSMVFGYLAGQHIQQL